METLSIVVNTLLFASALFILIVVLNNNLLCAIFRRKDRNLWKKFIEKACEFKEVEVSVDDAEREFEYTDKETGIKYTAYLWSADGLVSIFTETDLILSQFDKKYSKLMAEKLLSCCESKS